MTQTCISPREKEVLDLIVDENSTKMIARELFISEHTVISHRKNLMTKLNASNAAGLVRRAYESGVLNLSRQVALFVLISLSVSSVKAQQTVVEHNSTFDNPHLELHEESDSSSLITFSNNQFADNRFFIKADPSSTGGNPALMTLGWGNIANSSIREDYVVINAASDEIGLNGDVFFDFPGDPDLPPGAIDDLGTYFNRTMGSFRGGKVSFSDAWALGNLGEGSFGYGNNVVASGDFSGAIGSGPEATGFASTAFGNATRSYATFCTSVGQFNDPIVAEGATIAPDDPMFIVGNGTGIGSSASNAFVVYKDGEVEVENVVRIGTFNSSPRPSLFVGAVEISSTDGLISNRLTVSRGIIPDDDNEHSLGEAGARWTEVWAFDGTINTSDKRAKKNISTSAYGLEDVLNLNPVMYNWKEEKDNSEKTIGLIAQELLEVIPEVVRIPENQEDYLGVKYAELIPVLIKAIQEQQSVIDTQIEEMVDMKAMISKLDGELSQINNMLLKKASLSE